MPDDSPPDLPPPGAPADAPPVAPPPFGPDGPALDREGFGLRLIGELAQTLQDVVGVEEAAGYVAVVGTAMGEHLDAAYREALGADRLGRGQVAQVLVDLKRRIRGDFFVIEESEDRIVLGTRSCPFGGMVEGRPSLCMMTSNVFGHIASQNLGYAAVTIEEAIARGDRGCRVVVTLRPGADLPAGSREYFGR
jgi:predicted ArsR family transcriptional regulator